MNYVIFITQLAFIIGKDKHFCFCFCSLLNYKTNISHAIQSFANENSHQSSKSLKL